VARAQDGMPFDEGEIERGRAGPLARGISGLPAH
jgi:hypothetical protein